MSVKEDEINTVILTPGFGFRKDSVFIGANCVSDTDTQLEEIEERIINPYRSNDDVVKAAEFCWYVSSNCCDELGVALNRIHNVTYGQSYWRIVLLPWMFAFSENVYDRYLRLRWVKEHYANALIEVPPISGNNILYESSFDVWSKGHLHTPNVRIYSYLIGQLGLREKIKYIDTKYIDIKSGNLAQKPILRTVLRGLRKKYREKVLYRMVDFCLGEAVYLRPSGRSQNMFKLTKRIEWIKRGVSILRNDGFSKKPIDRSQLIFKPSGDDFKDIILGMIRTALPVSLFEEFKQRRKLALSFIKKKNIKTIFMGPNFWVCDTDRILAAEVKSEGGSIIGVQYGGSYGDNALIIAERLERSIYDHYITWGWMDKGKCPTIPLPSSYLSKLANTHTAKNKNILFVGTHTFMYMFRYQGYWMPEYVLFKYYNLKERFFNTLEVAVKERILYRPYPQDYGWREKKRISEILPNARFFESGSAINGMKNCSLVVIDHPSTSFLEALQMNVPTILYWEDAQCPMRKEAEEYFQLLVDAGILYRDPEAAARKVNEVSDDPIGWWLKKKVQDARIKFCENFAYARKDWLEIWKEKLTSLNNANE